MSKIVNLASRDNVADVCPNIPTPQADELQDAELDAVAGGGWTILACKPPGAPLPVFYPVPYPD